MKKQDSKLITLRSKIHLNEVYYTFADWPTREVDGMEFLSVVRQKPTQEKKQSVYYVRKDSLEKVKNA